MAQAPSMSPQDRDEPSMDPLEALSIPRWPHPDGHPPKNQEQLWRSQGPSRASGGAMINLDIPSPGLWILLVTSKEGESFHTKIYHQGAALLIRG